MTFTLEIALSSIILVRNSGMEKSCFAMLWPNNDYVQCFQSSSIEQKARPYPQGFPCSQVFRGMQRKGGCISEFQAVWM